MTMQFRLGLVGRDMTGTGRVMSWQQQGDDASVDVEYVLTSQDDAVTIVNQVLGLQESGTSPPVLPLEWDDEPARIGFYRVTGVDVSVDRPLLTVFKVAAKFTLSWVAAASGLTGEHVVWGADRAAMPSSWPGAGAWPRAWVAWPTVWFDHLGLASGTRALSATETMGVWDSIDYEGPTYSESVLTQPSPETFYDGAVTLKTGSSLQYVTGRRLPVDTGAWELSNGLVKVFESDHHDVSFRLQFLSQDGTAWSTRTRTASVFFGGATLVDEPRPFAIAVLRNTPEAVTIRLFVSTGLGTAMVDLNLRRGSRYVSVTGFFPVDDSVSWGLGYLAGCSSATAIDSPTVGVAETADDVDGNRSLALMGSVQVSGWNIYSNGRIVNGGSYRSLEIAMGYVAGGGSAASVDQAPNVERQYFAAVGEVFRIVRS